MKIDSPTFLSETTFISSSVVFSSGSQKFGNTADDEHHFTGSLHISGSRISLDDDKRAMGGDKKIHGLIAQEVKQALDNQGVDTFGGWGEEDDGRQHISFESFVLPLIKSVQELSSENKQLKDKLNDLEIFIMDKLGDK